MTERIAQQQILKMLHEVKVSIEQMEGLHTEMSCREALLRLSCIKSAIEQIGIYVLESCAVECLQQDKRKVLDTMDDMADIMASLKRNR